MTGSTAASWTDGVALSLVGGLVDHERSKKLRRLLERLGTAIHASVVDSEEVKSCLSELQGGGWDAVMFLEAALGCRSDGGADPAEGALRIHVGNTHGESEYRLMPEDARWLAAIGISPTRHRSHPQRPLPPLDQGFPRARGDG
jgi:hypothetical protein